MLSGEIYLRLKPYLVVEISSDIVTEHCCQSMRSVYDVLPLWLPAMCWHGKWLRNLETPRRTMWSARPTWDIKIFFTFDFHTYYRNQSSYHDDKSTLQRLTCVFCPQLIRNVRSRRRIYSSSIIGYPVNSDLHTWERLLKCYAKNSTHIYITLLIIDMDFLYQFNMGLIAPLFTVSFHEKFEKKCFLKFSKLAGLWLVDIVDNHVAIYGSKVAEDFSALQRRSCFLYKFLNIIVS